uniref:Uncharacterized protein n=1 Tax=Rhizophora mucronata TaxID=61149 RepID=A0A2P2K400_RHIMU
MQRSWRKLTFHFLILIHTSSKIMHSTNSTRMHGEDSDAEPLRETSSAGSSDWDVEKPVKDEIVGTRGQHDLVKLNSQRMHGLTLTDKPANSSYSDENEICSSSGLLVFEYLEQEQPYFRDPLYEKASPFQRIMSC